MKTRLFLALFLVLGLSQSTLQDEDDDDVTVEVEPEVDDVPYTSPVPSGNYFLAENFDEPAHFNRKWVTSKAKKDGVDEEELARYDGVWQVESPKIRSFGGTDRGLVLASKAKHAAIAARLERPFKFLGEPLIIQYEVLFQEGQECGGAYIKLLSQGQETADLSAFVDKTPYTIMFGPDKCGNDVKLHFIFRHKNPKNGSFEEKHCKKPKDRLQHVFDDKKPHLYTLIVRQDNSFQILVDHKIVNEGNLLEDFEPAVNPPEEIDDPADVKPTNWDEREQIPDPEASKPEDWDEDAPAKIVDESAKKPSDWLENEEAMVPDPDAEKPADWDTDMDGEWEPALVENPLCASVSGCGKWEPPLIPNPAYKGKWRPPLIDNPNYQGKWRPRRIRNPDHFHDPHPYKMTPISAVGFELWSMSANILFDNIIITDSIAVADDYAAKTYDIKIRKIDADSQTFFEQLMRSLNYKPGWWAVYLIYCLIPLLGYIYYLFKRVQEESVITRVIKYSNERPYLYAVYLIVVALPIALIAVYCFGKKDELLEPHPKKTDPDLPGDKISSTSSAEAANDEASVADNSDIDDEEEEDDEARNDDDDDGEEMGNARAEDESPRIRQRRVKPPKV